jgi:hypothetical protein
VIQLLQDEPKFEQEVIIDAIDGRWVVNLYRPVFAKAPAYVWRQFLDDFYQFPATMEVISKNILLFTEDARKFSKWNYMRDYVKMGQQRLLRFIGEVTGRLLGTGHNSWFILILKLFQNCIVENRDAAEKNDDRSKRACS